MRKELLTYAEVSDHTGISVDLLYQLVSQRRIPHVRFGPRFVRFRLDEVRQWIESHRVDPR